jgi:molybdate transport system substrate-binding protein
MPARALTLLSSMATRELLRELAACHAQATGQPVEAQGAGGVDVAKRVRAGEAVDIVVLASKVIDELIGEGVLAGPRVDLVRSGVGIAVRAGTPRVDVSSEAAVRDAVLAARTLSYSTGPSGTWLQGLFERWGIAERIGERIVVPPPGVPVGSLVADGRAELGFQQLSELINLAGIQVLGPLPPEIQTLTVFSAAVSSASDSQDAARAFLRYMASPQTAEVKVHFGMEAA